MPSFALMLSFFAAFGALLAADTARAEGALAIGECGAYGYSVNNDSLSVARQRALRQCRSHDGKNCEIKMTLSGNCGAFATDRNRRCGAGGWARRATRSEAEKVAIAQCHKFGGTNCRIRTAICDTPPAPALTTNWTSTTLGQNECLARARQVMKDAGLTTNFETVGQSVFGEQGDYTAQIRCISEKNVVIFAVIGRKLDDARAHMKAIFEKF
jgi:hypothetical protein